MIQRFSGFGELPSGRTALTYVAATVVGIYLLAPFAWLVITSFMREAEALSVPPHWIPEDPTLANYAAFINPVEYGAFAGGRAVEQVWSYMINSLVVSLSVSVINIVIGSMSAYALARMNFRGQTSLVIFYLGSRMVPSVAIMIPIFMAMSALRLLDNLIGLIVTYTTFTLPFTIWILRSYFQTIPRDLEDAARIDRCNWINMMIRVFLPVATPALVAAAMFAFMASWGEFLYAVILTSTEASKTMTVAVSQFATDLYIEKTLMTAGGVLAVIPPLVLALLFQRLIIQGLVSGSVKG